MITRGILIIRQPATLNEVFLVGGKAPRGGIVILSALPCPHKVASKKGKRKEGEEKKLITINHPRAKMLFPSASASDDCDEEGATRRDGNSEIDSRAARTRQLTLKGLLRRFL